MAKAGARGASPTGEAAARPHGTLPPRIRPRKMVYSRTSPLTLVADKGGGRARDLPSPAADKAPQDAPRGVPAGKMEHDTATVDKAAGRFTEDVASTVGAAQGVEGGRLSEAGVPP